MSALPRVDLDRVRPATERAARLRGVYLAVVTAHVDAGGDSRARVKVRFGWLPDGDESHWARVLAPMAGAGRGTYFPPQPGDQVLVVFEHGDIARPIVVGGLWSQAQVPPQTNPDGTNDIRVIKSKNGHRLVFDDRAGAERVIVVDATRRNKVVLDVGNDALTIESQSGNISLIARAGSVKIHGQTVAVTAAGTLEASGVEVKASGASFKVVAPGAVSLSGAAVALNEKQRSQR